MVFLQIQFKKILLFLFTYYGSTEAYSCHVKEKKLCRYNDIYVVITTYYGVITTYDGCRYYEILSRYNDILSRYNNI